MSRPEHFLNPQQRTDQFARPTKPPMRLRDIPKTMAPQTATEMEELANMLLEMERLKQTILPPKSPFTKPIDLTSKPPRDTVPTKFSKTANIKVGWNRDIFDKWGMLGAFYPSPGGKIDLVPKLAGSNVYAHELGHSIWHDELTPEQQKNWFALVESSQGRAKALGESIPWELTPQGNYPNDPTHSFAELFSNYVTGGKEMKTSYPSIYRFLMDTIGMEYSRKDYQGPRR